VKAVKVSFPSRFVVVGGVTHERGPEQMKDTFVLSTDYDALLALARRLRKSLTDEKAYGGGTVYCAETNETIFDSAWLEE
jgi:hypothetical protein